MAHRRLAVGAAVIPSEIAACLPTSRTSIATSQMIDSYFLL
jgi:hypothetical protein